MRLKHVSGLLHCNWRRLVGPAPVYRRVSIDRRFYALEPCHQRWSEPSRDHRKQADHRCKSITVTKAKLHHLMFRQPADLAHTSTQFTISTAVAVAPKLCACPLPKRTSCYPYTPCMSATGHHKSAVSRSPSRRRRIGLVEVLDDLCTLEEGRLGVGVLHVFRRPVTYRLETPRSHTKHNSPPSPQLTCMHELPSWKLRWELTQVRTQYGCHTSCRWVRAQMRVRRSIHSTAAQSLMRHTCDIRTAHWRGKHSRTQASARQPGCSGRRARLCGRAAGAKCSCDTSMLPGGTTRNLQARHVRGGPAPGGP